MPETVSVQAVAKVNLTLHIVGKRADGLHQLESLIGFTAVADRISLTNDSDINLAITGPEAGTLARESENLAVKAAHLARCHAGTESGAHIAMEKNIPVAAGLGGGSADAAAVIRGCFHLWNVSPPESVDFTELAATLGADVPVCHFGRAAWVSGIGEVIASAPAFPDLWLVLINPRVAVSTAAVFQSFSGTHQNPEFQNNCGPAWDASADGFIEYLSMRSNDLAEPAIKTTPVISDVINGLDATKGCLLARMSGSGPTCFGMFGSNTEAHNAAQELADSHPAWWVQSSPLLAVAPA